MVNAAPVLVELSGYIQERDSSPATIEYFGASPGDEFRMTLTFDLDTFDANRKTREFAYSLVVGDDSGYELNVDSDLPYVSNMKTRQLYRPHGPVVNGWSHQQPDDTGRSILSFSVGYVDLFALDGDVGRGIRAGDFNHHVIDYTTGRGYKIHGRFTKGTVSPGPGVAAVPAPGAMLLAAFGASIVGWFRQKRLIG